MGTELSFITGISVLLNIILSLALLNVKSEQKQDQSNLMKIKQSSAEYSFKASQCSAALGQKVRELRDTISSLTMAEAKIADLQKVITSMSVANQAQSKSYEKQIQHLQNSANIPFLDQLEAENNSLTARLENAKKENDQLTTQVEELREKLESTAVRASTMYIAMKSGISLSVDNLPIYHNSDPRRPYGDLTAYVNKQSGIYHMDYCCAPYVCEPQNYFEARKKYTPCKKCGRKTIWADTTPNWLREISPKL